MSNVLNGNKILLRFITYNDLETLLEWRNNKSFLTFCTKRKNKLSLEDFTQELTKDFENDRFCQMMIIKKSTGQEIGTIYCYNLDRNNGYTFVTTYLSDNYVDFGYGAEAFILFCIHLFNLIRELQKIYVDVYKHNKRSMSCLTSGGFTEEEIISDKDLHNKQKQKVRLCFYREYLYNPKTIDLLAKLKMYSQII